MSSQYEKYYVPPQSPWPIVGATALFLVALGAGTTVSKIHQTGDPGWGKTVLILGIVVLLVMMFGWFRDQINESRAGMYSAQLGRSYRQGMQWFIFSEVMFFAAFFGALFYARLLSIPWLDGASNNASTAAILWPEFQATWPLIKTPGGTETTAMGWAGLPLINTVILIASSFTVHIAHVGLEKNKRKQLTTWLGITVVLGCIFLVLQVEEYIHAYRDLNLTLESGIYGNTFFLLTGFHGLHVTLGTIFLAVMFFRVLAGHFSHDNQFAFQAASWYWHFVDVVWLFLFVFVYVL
ncbi:cytochrome c oxidase subunit 3 [Saccharobesus litoralis]|uniref:cytochrome-c oxidase n=1 Tax=Saccharobesus litoralis TaxID=2172099 RepID=A0A2S0VR64_9ALTE|nr:cytochrome c oxidase subunit 3 [Saccharobesus litoralis]AWB66689.1 cytochrome c oxidase subunit 3 [Saccharobesus litoralis]